MRVIFIGFCLICAPGAAAWMGARLSFAPPIHRLEVYRGIHYQTSRDENGIVHLIEVDLSSPGIDLYLTPLNEDARVNGHQYRLDYVRNVARAEGLAVAVNGTMFSSDSYLMPMVGDFATSIDTIVADHQVSHLQARDFLLWFDDSFTPNLETKRPAPPEALKQAKWAVGTQNLATRGVKRGAGDGRRDKRCALGINPDARKMWIGVFESASREEVRQRLVNAGAQHVMLLDGGDSTSLYLGGRAYHVPHGLRFGGQRPVATVLGIRADPILDPL